MTKPDDPLEAAPALPPRARRRLLWWMLNGCWLIVLSGISLRHELGFFGWALIGLGVYGGILFGGFALFPHELPEWIDALCIGNMREEYCDLVWSSRRDLYPDKVDRTWVVPAVVGLIELLGFSGVF